MLLRKKAAEELKKEQERKAAERRRIIEERCGKPKNIDDANEGNHYYFSTSMCNTIFYPVIKLNHIQFISFKDKAEKLILNIYLYTLQFTAYFRPLFLCCCVCHIIDTVRTVCRDYHTRIGNLEDEKFDLEYIVKRKDMEVVRRAATEPLPFGLNLQTSSLTL